MFVKPFLMQVPEILAITILQDSIPTVSGGSAEMKKLIHLPVKREKFITKKRAGSKQFFPDFCSEKLFRPY